VDVLNTAVSCVKGRAGTEISLHEKWMKSESLIPGEKNVYIDHWLILNKFIYLPYIPRRADDTFLRSNGEKMIWDFCT
jgi:hypothetical protein